MDVAISKLFKDLLDLRNSLEVSWIYTIYVDLRGFMSDLNGFA